MAPVRLRTLLLVWIVLGMVLAAVQVLALVNPDLLQSWLRAVQEAYGFAAPVPGWGRSDRHAHLIVSAVACLWFALGCRLFAPRSLPWLPVALTVLLILADELRQLGGPGRSFELGDLVAGGLGLALAFPGIMWLQRLAVACPQAVSTRPPRTVPP